MGDDFGPGYSSTVKILEKSYLTGLKAGRFAMDFIYLLSSSYN